MPSSIRVSLPNRNKELRFGFWPTKRGEMPKSVVSIVKGTDAQVGDHFHVVADSNKLIDEAVIALTWSTVLVQLVFGSLFEAYGCS